MKLRWKSRRGVQWGWLYWLKKFRGDPMLKGLSVPINPKWHQPQRYDQ